MKSGGDPRARVSYPLLLIKCFFCELDHTSCVSSHTHTQLHTSSSPTHPFILPHTTPASPTHPSTHHTFSPLHSSSPQSQEHMFTWDIISNYEADLEEQAFTFQYNREGRSPRWVKVFSPFVSPHQFVPQFVPRQWKEGIKHCHPS